MDTLVYILARADPNQGCTKQTCEPSQSVYGYRPSLSATVVFLAIFALSGLTYTYQGIRTKTWFFTISMLLGCLSEVIGYVAKLLLWNDPFSDTGFKISVVLLTFAPAFYSAGIYYNLKHIALTFGASFSRLKPAWYTWIFISCDLFSIVLQGVGGGIASAAASDKTLRVGDNVMITGLATQVFTMLAFGSFALDYLLSTIRPQNRRLLNPATAQLRQSPRFRLFLLALWLAYLAILLRCVYRLAELAQGWGPQNNILRNQGLFIGLDSVPCALASLVLNIWHPGYCFPRDEAQRGGKLADELSSAEGEEVKNAAGLEC